MHGDDGNNEKDHNTRENGSWWDQFLVLVN